MWPKGCNFEDMPADLFNIINHALLIVSWQENLSGDEMPEYWKWHLDWEIEEHFAKVKRAREAKYGTSKDNIDDKDDNGNDIYEKNALFDDFIK